MNINTLDRGLGGKKIVVLTGRPGIGKTTVFARVISRLRSIGLIVGGIVCPEVRVGNSRIGFKIVDLMSGEEGWLARLSVACAQQKRVGKYCVEVDDVITIGVKALKKAMQYADIIGIDEIGPMELSVPQLRDAIISTLSHSRRVLAVVHLRLNDEFIIKLLKPALKYEVNLSNRETLHEEILNALLT